MTALADNTWEPHLHAVQETIRVVGQGANAEESLATLRTLQAELEDCLRLVETQRDLLAQQRPGNGSAEDSEEGCVAHTEQGRTNEEMARAFDAISRPVAQESVPLSIDPDDYPLF